MAKKVELKGRISMDTSAFEAGLNKAVRRAAVAGAAIGTAMAAGIAKSIQAASDLQETMTKTGAIFGQSSKDIEKWASGAARSFGQSKQQAMDAAGTFGIFGKSAGLAGGELVDFSRKLTELSSDFASFYNTSPEDAITAIGAALRGESEPIRRYGILLDAATLKQEALRMGLISTTKDALTPQQRVLASYNVILAQSRDAQGDFAKTADGLANSTRSFSAEMADLAANVGEAFLPAATEAVKQTKELLKLLSDKGIVEDFAESIMLIPAAWKFASAELADHLAMLKKVSGFLSVLPGPLGAVGGAAGFLPGNMADVADELRGEGEDYINRRAKEKGPKVRGEKGGPGASGASGTSDTGEAGGSGSEQSPAYEGFEGGAGAFAPSYLTMGTQAPAELPSLDGSFKMDRDFFGTGVTPPSELDMFDAAAGVRSNMPGPKAGKWDRFKDFSTFSGPSNMSGPAAQFGAIGGLSTGGGGQMGGAYGTIRRGDAARKKAEDAERMRKEEESKNDPVVQAINHPAWVTETG